MTAHHNSTIIIFYQHEQNITQFVKFLLIKLSYMLHSSKFVRLFHHQSFTLHGTKGTTPVKTEYTGISKTNTTTESNTVTTQMDVKIESIFSAKALSLLPGADLPV